MTTQTQKLGMITLLAALFINGGCGGSSNSGNSDGTEASLDNCPGTVSGNQTDPAAGDSCPATATTYTFASKITEGESSVSYTGFPIIFGDSSEYSKDGSIYFTISDGLKVYYFNRTLLQFVQRSF